MPMSTQNDVQRVPCVTQKARARNRWGIILSGGEGKRMHPLVSSWLGENRPKQYCTFVGSRSMFQHTVDRAGALVPEEHLVTIIGRGHRRFLSGAARASLPGLLIEQPRDVGTAPGVFLPAAYVLAHDPDAVVALFPSDHFVYPEDAFCRHVNRAFDLAESYADRVLLMGAVPSRPETDYGWIGSRRGPGVGRTRTQLRGPLEVTDFREKPDANEANLLLRQGCLWNTMVMVAKAQTLWSLGRQCLPEMMYGFDAFLLVLRAIRERQIGPEFETIALGRLYEELAPADFSRDILQQAPERSMVLPMDGVDWCDWGQPQRVSETLERLDRRPLFPLEFVKSRFEPLRVKSDFPGPVACENNR